MAGQRRIPSAYAVILTPYSQQKKLIRDKLVQAKVDLPTASLDEWDEDVLSFDGAQGQQWDLVIISGVRSRMAHKAGKQAVLGFLTEPKRCTVALSRHRRQCVIFGDIDTLARTKPFFEARRCANAADPGWRRRTEYAIDVKLLRDDITRRHQVTFAKDGVTRVDAFTGAAMLSDADNESTTPPLVEDVDVVRGRVEVVAGTADADDDADNADDADDDAGYAPLRLSYASVAAATTPRSSPAGVVLDGTIYEDDEFLLERIEAEAEEEASREDAAPGATGV